MGGVVNVITRSGGNEFHGDIIGYYNDNDILMQGKAREYLRWNPYDDNLARVRQQRRPVLSRRQEPRRLQAVRRRLQPGRLHPQGPPVVLRLLQPPVYSRTVADRFTFDPVTDRGQIPGDTAPAATYSSTSKNFNWNGQAKLTAAPFKGLRMSASLRQQLLQVPRRASRASAAPAPRHYPWRQLAGLDAWQAGRLRLSQPESRQRHVDYTRQQQLPGQRPRRLLPCRTRPTSSSSCPGTRYDFNRTNMHVYAAIHRRQTCSTTPAGTTGAGSRTVIQRKYTRRAHARQPRPDLLRQPGRRTRLEGRLPVHPPGRGRRLRPGTPWSTCTGAVLLRPCRPTASHVRGTYGYYDIRGYWTSPYGSNWNIASNN